MRLQRRAKREGRMAGLLIAIGAAGTGFILAFHHIFHSGELLVVLYPLSFGVTVLITFIIRRLLVRSQDDSYRFETSGLQKNNSPGFSTGITRTWFLACFGIAAILMDGIFFIDCFADTSPATPYTAMVLEKHLSYGRHGSKYYYAVIASPVPSPLPFTFFRNETVLLDRSEFDDTFAGRTAITINLHKGFFGLPWYEWQHRLTSSSASLP